LTHETVRAENLTESLAPPTFLPKFRVNLEE